MGLTVPNIWHETAGLAGEYVNINNKLLLDNESSLFPPANCILSEGGADHVRAGWINSDL